MIIFGIETSCDDTSIAIVDSDKKIISHHTLSQHKEHESFGGIVPEIAARSHMEYIALLAERATKDLAKHLNLHNADKAEVLAHIDAIAVTAGPGLIGSLLVGVNFAKGLALALSKPIIAVNHLVGHALVARLTSDAEFPFLLLLVSGGHCQILIAKDIEEYQRLGGTIDDSIGEAFDKVAKMLNLGYPGGPAVEEAAQRGDSLRFPLPKPLLHSENCNFSFSGLKTAVKRTIERLGDLREQDIDDICASFQFTVTEVLVHKLRKALLMNPALRGRQLVVAGGVAANQYIRQALKELATEHDLQLVFPPVHLCTDNGVMIAWAGLEMFARGRRSDLNIEPKSRWPIGTAIN